MRSAVRTLSLATWLSIALLDVMPSSIACAQSQADADANVAERSPGEQVVRLEDQLLNGLRVVNSEQRLYIAQVNAMVDSGQIPRAMVNVVYIWALKRNPHVPFPYFQIALRALGERRGIAIP